MPFRNNRRQWRHSLYKFDYKQWIDTFSRCCNDSCSRHYQEKIY
ncbi:MAG: hypothetical protein J6J52_01420 [Oscillospiraceae bacterium]|nr:hypothetical protein [Oscillospiraceae bacterium]